MNLLCVCAPEETNNQQALHTLEMKLQKKKGKKIGIFSECTCSYSDINISRVDTRTNRNSRALLDSSTRNCSKACSRLKRKWLQNQKSKNILVKATGVYYNYKSNILSRTLGYITCTIIGLGPLDDKKTAGPAFTTASA